MFLSVFQLTFCICATEASTLINFFEGFSESSTPFFGKPGVKNFCSFFFFSIVKNK